MRLLSESGVRRMTPCVKARSVKMQRLANAKNARIHVFHLITSECCVNKMRRPKASQKKYQRGAECQEPRCRAVGRPTINIGNSDPGRNGRTVEQEQVWPRPQKFIKPSGQPGMKQPAVNRP